MVNTANLDRNTIKVLLSQGIINISDLSKLNQNNTYSDGIPVIDSLNKFYQHLRSDGSIHTANGYKQNVVNFIKFVFKTEELDTLADKVFSGDNLSLDVVSEWLEYLISNGYDSNSIRRFKYALNSYFSYLTDNYDLPKMDVLVLETPTIELSDIHALRDEEIREMAQYATSTRNKLIILLMYEAGLKRQEVIDCKKSDIDLNQLTVTIRDQNGKTDRIGYISATTGQLVKDYIAEWEDEVADINYKRRKSGSSHLLYVSEYLFQTTRGYKISYSTIFKAIKDTAYEYYTNKARQLGLSDKDIDKKVSSVDTEIFRHSKRVYLFAHGNTVEQVQTLMGDKNQWVTKRYLAISQQLYPELFK